MELDAIDRNILRALQDDGRQSMSSLAQRVGLTTTPLRQRVEKLREAGVICGIHARVHPAAVGRSTTAFVLVTLRDHTREHHLRFVEEVEAMPEVLEAHHIAGDEDFMLKVVTRDIAAFESFLIERLTPLRGVSRVKTMFVLSSAKTYAPIPIDDDPRGTP